MQASNLANDFTFIGSQYLLFILFILNSHEIPQKKNRWKKSIPPPQQPGLVPKGDLKCLKHQETASDHKRKRHFSLTLDHGKRKKLFIVGGLAASEL